MEPHEAIEQHEKTTEATEHAEKEGNRSFARTAAVIIAVLAAMLAIVTGVGNNATTETILSQGKAADTYNEYQANSIKNHVNTNDVAILRIIAAGSPARAEALKLAASLQKANKKYVQQKAVLLPIAIDEEKKRDKAENRHHTMQFAEGALQIAIVLSSVAVVVGVRALLFGGIGMGLVGLAFAIDGFVSNAKLPF